VSRGHTLPTVLIMAGGTGGHVFPGLAVAQVLRERGYDVVWLGTRTGLEARLVPEAGLPIEWLDVAGLRGKGLGSLLTAPLMLLRALGQAARIVRNVRPGLAIGLGGFVSGPGGLVAWLLNVPLVVHEQNAVAGTTNRILARFAKVVFEAFPNSFGSGVAARQVGNPVRRDIAAIAAPGERVAGRTGCPRVLVIGGSQGARALNDAVPQALALLPQQRRPDIRHQSGTSLFEATRGAYAAAEVTADIAPFISDMAAAYAWADLVICRSGALTVSELAAAGVGSILVPFPHAVDDHQTANAAFLVEAGAAVLMPQETLSAQSLAECLGGLLSNRWRLEVMAEAARSVAHIDAAERIVDEGLRHVRV